MKYILALLTAITLPIMAQAQFTGPSNKLAASTVAEAKNMRDETHVVLEGVIERKIKHERYLFNDGTNTIVLEIDDDVWLGLNVSETDRVRVFGEVDRSMFRDTKVDVETIEIIK
ncbi:MAG: NirD/YgiW/YdeI family stress tolerance protein [Rickettsiales bacterium]|jgi:uncharacterized protein (TIGR00156 family)|nr:NirD/YgiW/YdeI family stress tolerance protein [Rickettsiales bacterium]